MTRLVPDLPDLSDSRAVLLGASDYADLPRVDAVANNLRAVREALRRDDLLGLPDQHIAVLDDARLAGGNGVRTVIEELTRCADEARNTLLFYFAGHGVLDEDGDDGLYLAVPGTSGAGASYTAVPFTKIGRVISQAPALKKVIILDCCYSGRALSVAITADGKGEPLLSNGMAMLTSSPPGAPSMVDPDGVHTAFTGHLVRLLTSGVEDGPELITMEILFGELFDIFKAGQLTEPGAAYRGSGTRIALVRNLRHDPSNTAAGPPLDDVGRLVAVLNQTLTAAGEMLRTADGTTADRLRDGLDAVADVLTVLRSGEDLPTTALLRVDRFVQVAAQSLAARPDLADRKAMPLDNRAELVMREVGGVYRRERDRIEDAYREFVRDLRAICADELRATARAVPELGADLQPVTVSVPLFPTRASSRALAEDLARQLTGRAARELRERLERRLTDRWFEMLDSARHARAAFDDWLGRAPAPGGSPDPRIGGPFRFDDGPRIDSRVFDPLAAHIAGVAAAILVVAAVVTFPRTRELTRRWQIEAARRAVVTAVRDALAEPGIAEDIAEDIAAAAASAVALLRDDLDEAADYVRSGRYAADRTPTIRWIIEEAIRMVDQALR